MSTDRVEMSVRELKLFQSRSKTAEKRNGKRCLCEHTSEHRVSTKRFGVKMLRLARHGVLHLASCRHSTLAETTGSLVSLRVASRDPLSGYRVIPTLIVR